MLQRQSVVSTFAIRGGKVLAGVLPGVLPVMAVVVVSIAAAQFSLIALARQSTAIRHQGQSQETIMLDGYTASHRAVREMKAYDLRPADTQVRPSKYLNNLIGQDHRHIKSRTNVMLGFKRFRSVATTISSIELMHRIRKGQFDLTKLGLKDAAAPAVWNAVLSNR
jgi:hypothetical protein